MADAAQNGAGGVKWQQPDGAMPQTAPIFSTPAAAFTPVMQARGAPQTPMMGTFGGGGMVGACPQTPMMQMQQGPAMGMVMAAPSTPAMTGCGFGMQMMGVAPMTPGAGCGGYTSGMVPATPVGRAPGTPGMAGGVQAAPGTPAMAGYGMDMRQMAMAGSSGMATPRAMSMSAAQQMQMQQMQMQQMQMQQMQMQYHAGYEPRSHERFSDGEAMSLRHAPRRKKGTTERTAAPCTPASIPMHWKGKVTEAGVETKKKTKEAIPDFNAWQKKKTKEKDRGDPRMSKSAAGNVPLVPNSSAATPATGAGMTPFMQTTKAQDVTPFLPAGGGVTPAAALACGGGFPGGMTQQGGYAAAMGGYAAGQAAQQQMQQLQQQQHYLQQQAALVQQQAAQQQAQQQMIQQQQQMAMQQQPMVSGQVQQQPPEETPTVAAKDEPPTVVAKEEADQAPEPQPAAEATAKQEQAGDPAVAPSEGGAKGEPEATAEEQPPPEAGAAE